MSDVQALRPRINERQLRIDLAAACRLASRLDWQEAVANHFSVATSDDGRYFLLKPAVAALLPDAGVGFSAARCARRQGTGCAADRSDRLGDPRHDARPAAAGTLHFACAPAVCNRLVLPGRPADQAG